MKKIYIRNIFIGLGFIGILCSAVMSQSGQSGPYTNAPGENNCTSCHTGSLISSGNANLNNIRLTPNFTQGGYEIDSTYSIELTFKQSGIARFGFEITCLSSTNNDGAGTFSTSNSRVRRTTSYVSGKLRDYVLHTYAGSSPVATDSTRWVFNWKAPSSNIGKVKFYVTVNAANNNGQDNGDLIYVKTFEFACASGVPVAKANTSTTNVCTNTNVSFQGSGTNAPNAWSWTFTNATPSSTTSKNPTVKFYAPGKQCHSGSQ